MVTKDTFDRLSETLKAYPSYILRVRQHEDSEDRAILVIKDNKIVYDKASVPYDELEGELQFLMVLVQSKMI